MNRVAASVSGHLEQRAREAHEVFEPHRLEPELGAESAKLVRHRIVQKVIAGDDGHGRVALILVRAQPPEKAEAVDERHAEVENDRVGPTVLRFAQTHFCAQGGVDVIALEPQHPREGGRDAFVVVDDKYRACRRFRHRGGVPVL